MVIFAESSVEDIREVRQQLSWRLDTRCLFTNSDFAFDESAEITMEASKPSDAESEAKISEMNAEDLVEQKEWRDACARTRAKLSSSEEW
jgi:hypothetical protein